MNKTALVCAFLLGSQTALAAGIDDATNKPLNLLQARPSAPVQLRQHAPTLQELIVRSPMPLTFFQPIPLRGVNITGLYPKSVESLGFQYFVVVDNTKFLRMSEIYRECRLNGKSNFVTTDSITHPYLAFSNRILAQAAANHMVPELSTLVQAMQRVSLADYRASDDAEVRSDIERNIAYLAVAQRLLDPACGVPTIGAVPELVDEEVKAVIAGTTAHSAIFEGSQDYSVFLPIGWYNSSPVLQNFYRCKEWLSLVPFAINDTGARRGNMFRRSVLMFRSLDQANILGKPAMETWLRLQRGYALLGSPMEAWGQRTLYPQDYKFVFQDKSADLRVTLQALAEPFFRTKLMLAVRNQKPMNLSSESIFDLAESDSSASMPVFRLFPMFGEPEAPWLRGVARHYPIGKEEGCAWPLSLIDLYAWGSPQAGNVLNEISHILDPNIAKVLPGLQHCVAKRSPTGQLVPVDSRSWKVLGSLFKPVPDAAPAVLHSDLWHSQRLISAFGGWIDAASAIAPADDTSAMANPTVAQAEGNTSEGVGAPPSANATNPQPRRVSKIPPYHYLEPNIELYKHLEEDAARMHNELQAMGYFEARYKTHLGDFVRLFQRLAKISETELRGQQVSIVDRRLLADIDLILDKVDVPLPAVLTFDGGKAEPGGLTRGFNMAVGRPGLLYTIIQDPHTAQWTVCRGAVYTYYEMPAPLLTQSMWQHKLEAGFAQPPCWSQKWQLVQDGKGEHKDISTVQKN